MTFAASRDVLGEHFVRTVQGAASAAVLTRHVFPVAAIPVLVLAAPQVNLLITNIGLMQVALNIPGSFRRMSRVFENGDVPSSRSPTRRLMRARLDPRVRDERAATWSRPALR